MNIAGARRRRQGNKMDEKSLTADFLQKLKSDALEATPGPWKTDGNSILLDYDVPNYCRCTYWGGNYPEFVASLGDGEYDQYTDDNEMRANARHIANCYPEVIVALVNEIERLRKYANAYAQFAHIHGYSPDIRE